MRLVSVNKPVLLPKPYGNYIGALATDNNLATMAHTYAANQYYARTVTILLKETVRLKYLLVHTGRY